MVLGGRSFTFQLHKPTQPQGSECEPEVLPAPICGDHCAREYRFKAKSASLSKQEGRAFFKALFIYC